MEPFRIPLIVGVTGHRELHPDDVSRIEGQLRAFFMKLMDRHRHTPLMLLSALGPGSDRLAAKVATEMHGIDLAAILPWPEGVCDEQWHRGGDRAEFDGLLGKARHVICLPLPEGVDPAGVPDSRADQQRCFAEVGRYITRHCQALAAIWNGEKGDESQTWQVIRSHLNGDAAPFAPGFGCLDEPETGPYWHFPARRLATDSPLECTQPVEHQPAHHPESFREIANHFDRFNHDVVEIGPHLSGGLIQSRGYLFPDDLQESLHPSLRFALNRFAIADQLASWWQKVSLWVFVAILGLIFALVTCFEFYAHFAPDRVSLLSGYLLISGLGWGFYSAARRFRVFNRYLDDRALAEAMRVHLYWKFAGIRESAADFYLRSCRSQLDWIRAALRAWTVQSGEHDDGFVRPAKALSGPAIFRQVRELWMRNQLDFFGRNKERDQHRAHRCHQWARGFLCVAVSAAVIQLGRLLWSYVHHDHSVGHDGLTHLIIVIIAMGGVLAGLCHEYLEKRLFEKQARSYEWMESLYRTALGRFDELIQPDETKPEPVLTEKENVELAKTLILELGREALAENADWVIYHREHEPKMKTH